MRRSILFHCAVSLFIAIFMNACDDGHFDDKINPVPDTPIIDDEDEKDAKEDEEELPEDSKEKEDEKGPN